MKIEAKQIETENWSAIIGRLLAEPFLVVGMAVFWAIALPAAALLVALAATFGPVLAYLRTPAMAGSRMSQSAI